MALFGNDRSILPSFRTAPELDSNARSPYDDLNRIERIPERTPERTTEQAAERIVERNGRLLDRETRDERTLRDDRRDLRMDERATDRAYTRAEGRDEPAAEERPAAARPVPQRAKDASSPDPLIAGLFDKLPEPACEWPLQARLKWLQTAANIFDLMYTAKDTDGELTLRLEKNMVR